MTGRGFFSAFLGGFAILLMVAILYSASTRLESQSRADEIFIVQQELSKDWFLARNAYSNFAADAIYHQIITPTPPSPSSCSQPPPSTDYSASVLQYWGSVSAFLKNNLGVDCQATLNGSLKNAFEGADNMTVEDSQNAYAMLHCKRTVGEATLELNHPFVFKKKVRVTNPPGSCVVEILDILGNPAGTMDVSQTFT